MKSGTIPGRDEKISKDTMVAGSRVCTMIGIFGTSPLAIAWEEMQAASV